MTYFPRKNRVWNGPRVKNSLFWRKASTTSNLLIEKTSKCATAMRGPSGAWGNKSNSALPNLDTCQKAHDSFSCLPRNAGLYFLNVHLGVFYFNKQGPDFVILATRFVFLPLLIVLLLFWGATYLNISIRHGKNIGFAACQFEQNGFKEFTSVT